MSPELAGFNQLVQELRSTSSKNKKITILVDALKQRPNFVKLLDLVYNPFIKFYLKSSDYSETIPNDLSILGLLDGFNKRKYTGNTARGMWAHYLNNCSEMEKTLSNLILNKDLKAHTGVSIVNAALAQFGHPPIPEFEVALGASWDKKPVWEKETYFVSRKLDGVRCLAFMDEGEVYFMSRTGHEFHTLGVLKEILMPFKDRNIVLDGELCLVDDNGNESFSGIMSQFSKKNHTIKHPKFLVFDCLSTIDFRKQFSPKIFSDRLREAQTFIKEINSPNISLLTQRKATTDLVKLMREAVTQKGWEGLILRKDTVYYGKRSKDILKVKEFFDAEYKVKRIETGDFPVVKDGSHLVKAMTAVVIEHKGYEVSVGSGWSLEQRQKFYANPEQIIGKIITVRYFEETTNQQGGISLRFPTVKCIHGDKRIG